MSQAKWYQETIIYELHVRSFCDGNGDGIGDFKGLISKLDYLQELGVGTLWLLPFYPSPLRDDGYDIANYMAIHPNYGTMVDFRTFLKEAHARGMKVITELVLNHTSDQHPWFLRACAAKPNSPHRDFYVWNDTPHKYEEARIIFKDFESSNWTWHPQAKAYYWHRFYSHQPDLNYDNPQVRRAVLKVLDFWLSQGVDGLRLDAVPYLVEREGTNCENLPETHAILKELRAYMDSKYPDRMFLAEANQWPEDARAYFGEGDECHMAYNFPVMPRIYMSIWMEDRHPLIDIMEQTPDIPEGCQWALFLRNHDELTLEMVTDEERDFMYQAFARDSKARINLGIRRRLAPLMQNDRRKMELINFLLFSLPGTPVIYYGDEIGMGDNYYLGDRNGVRTPMQWTPDRNAGFSNANPQALYLPVVIDPEYTYGMVNVETQEHNSSSFLWWMRRLIAVYKAQPALGGGNLHFVRSENTKVLSFLRERNGDHLLVVVNLSRFAQVAELELKDLEGYVPVDVFGMSRFPIIGDKPYVLTLGPYDYFWFRLESTHTAAAAQPHDLPVLTYSEEEGIFNSANWGKLEGNVLPALLNYRPADAACAPKLLKIIDTFKMRGPGHPETVLCLAEDPRGQGLQNYNFLLMSLRDEATAQDIQKKSNVDAITAQVKDKRNYTYSLLNGFQDEDGALKTTISLIWDRNKRKYRSSTFRNHNHAPKVLRKLLVSFTTPDSSPEITRIRSTPYTYACSLNRQLFVKFYRRPMEGINPEVELFSILTKAGDQFAHRFPGADFEYYHDHHESAEHLGEHTDSGFSEAHEEELISRESLTPCLPGFDLDKPQEDSQAKNEANLPTRVPRLLASLIYQTPQGKTMTLGVATAYVQGAKTGEAYVHDNLHLFFERAQTSNQPAPAQQLESAGDQLYPSSQGDRDVSEASIINENAPFTIEFFKQLGLSTARMHRVLADSKNPAMAPEPLTSLHLRSSYQSMRNHIHRVEQGLEQYSKTKLSQSDNQKSSFSYRDLGLFGDDSRELNDILATTNKESESKEELLPFNDIRKLCNKLLELKPSGSLIRIHGDYRLSNILYRSNEDLTLVGFDGDARLPITERAIKRSPLRDVASMLFSIWLTEEKALRNHPTQRTPSLWLWGLFWVRTTCNTFVDEYWTHMKGSGLVPEEKEEFIQLLVLFAVEQSLTFLERSLEETPEDVPLILDITALLLWFLN